MYTLRIWNKRSTNFNRNSFVAHNGTGLIKIDSQYDALARMSSLIHDPDIAKAIMSGPMGTLQWVGNPAYDPNVCNECDANCCDACNEE